MDVRIVVPDRHVTDGVLNAGLEAVTRLNEKLLHEGKIPTFAEGVRSGVRWRPEPPGLESFDHAGKVMGRKWGDCDDLAPWHAASLRASGIDPEATAVVYKSAPNRWHAIVQRGDGSKEDPSKSAGMKGKSAIPPAVVGPMYPSAAVVGGPPRPAIACRRVGSIFEARADVPWNESDYAMSTLARHPLARQALVGAMVGACLYGEVAGFADEEHVAKLLALSGLLNGESLREVAECYGDDIAGEAYDSYAILSPQLGGERFGGRPFDRRLQVSGDLFSDIANVAAPILKPVAKFVAPIADKVADVYHSLPKPLVAVLAPQALVTDYAVQHPQTIPMFGSLAQKAKDLYDEAKAKGVPTVQAAAAAHTVLHPIMQHPAVSAAPPAQKHQIALHVATAPKPPPLPTLRQVVQAYRPEIQAHKVFVPAGLAYR